MDEVRAFEEALLNLDRLEANRLLSSWDGESSFLSRVESIVIPAMESIGRGWEEGRVALTQVYMSGRICEELVESLLPTPVPTRPGQPKIALASLNDFHLLGKRMVHTALRAGGYVVSDFGRLDVEALVRRTCEEKPDVLMISVLMLPSALRVAQVGEELRRLGSPVKIAVGGAPFRLDDGLWREVGADAVGKSASDAPKILAQWFGGAS